MRDEYRSLKLQHFQLALFANDKKTLAEHRKIFSECTFIFVVIYAIRDYVRR